MMTRKQSTYSFELNARELGMSRGKFLAAGATAFVVAGTNLPVAGIESALAKPRRHVEALDPPSRFFSTAFVEYSDSLDTESYGDLWPCTWADDGQIYAPNGDGRGFSDEPFSDVVMNRISGTPETGITGERLAARDQIARIWANPNHLQQGGGGS